MHDVDITHMFHKIEFTKSGREIAEKAKAKAAVVRAKIEEREGRIKRIRDEYGITDAVLAEVLAQAMHSQTYSVVSNSRQKRSDGSEFVVPAGVITNLTTEQNYIASERDQVRRLELLARNVAPDVAHQLAYDELEYLGF